MHLRLSEPLCAQAKNTEKFRYVKCIENYITESSMKCYEFIIILLLAVQIWRLEKENQDATMVALCIAAFLLYLTGEKTSVNHNHNTDARLTRL